MSISPSSEQEDRSRVRQGDQRHDDSDGLSPNDISALATRSLLGSLPVSNICHELRTPLSVIISMAELLDSTPLDGEAREIVAHIVESSEELFRRMEEILTYITPPRGPNGAIDDPFDPRHLFGDLVGRALPLAEARDMAIVLAVDSDLPEVLSGNPRLLRRVFAILIDNALKFSERGRIRVTLSLEEASEITSRPPRLELRVIDEGIGIAPEDQLRIFLPFVQLDTSDAKRHGGLGLGLALARQLAESAEGRVVLEHSRLGQGTTMLAQFPVTAWTLDVDPPSASRGGTRLDRNTEAAPDALGIDLGAERG